MVVIALMDQALLGEFKLSSVRYFEMGITVLKTHIHRKPELIKRILYTFTY